MREPLSPDELQMRYFEWCSAQVAIRMATLAPEEIWQYAYGEPLSEHLRDAPSGEGASTFQDALRRSVHRVAEDLDLPSFEDWAARYADDPEPFDRAIRQVTGYPPTSTRSSGD